MKDIIPQYGQAVRLFQVQGLTGRLYGPNLTRGFEEKFNFLEAPRTAAQYDGAKGIVFQHGVLDGVVIDKFTLFNDGLVCETKVDTDFADRIIDEAILWAQGEAGIRIPAALLEHAGRIYLSRLVFEADLMLDQANKRFSKIGKAIAESIRAYGVTRVSDYALAGVHLHTDGGSMPGGTSSQTPAFSFERQINQPFSARRYFSSAPLKTVDHVSILKALEESLKD